MPTLSLSGLITIFLICIVGALLPAGVHSAISEKPFGKIYVLWIIALLVIAFVGFYAIYLFADLPNFASQSYEIPSHILNLPTATPKPNALYTCHDWFTITRNSYGKNICVTGTVLKTAYDALNDTFVIYFGEEQDDFIMVINGSSHPQELEGDCIVAGGEIFLLNDAPAMLITSDTLLVCPPGGNILPTPKPTQHKTNTPGIYSRTRTAQANQAALDQLSTEAFEKVPTCQYWSNITLDDVGKTMCVRGTVKQAWVNDQGTFFMSFGTDPSDFYFLAYNQYLEHAQNYCVQATGEINKIGAAPVMVVGPNNFEFCEP